MSISQPSCDSNLPNNDSMLSKFAEHLSKFVHYSALVFCWSYALLIFAIIGNVVLRYGFSSGLIIFEEIQWHLYAIGMMFGLSFAEITNSQVRVDIVAERLRRQTVRKWEIFGAVVFVLPFVYLCVVHGFEYVSDSYRVSESSNSPLGLPFRWAIKAVIPLSFSLLGIAIFSRLMTNIDALINNKDSENNHGN
ncbi:MAG: TRAP-type mannitol/chloroaromatic compound transport system permease small subunit [Colwellia sp.]|jgi:TRAP-type mannitol/chloroaromatic compound transport system permease small subunit|tara:strand:- start:8540 stop:9118 length:579 start_codon:yes stop_codon:yes gene_type:complete